jgi:hypothetical protein
MAGSATTSADAVARNAGVMAVRAAKADHRFADATRNATQALTFSDQVGAALYAERVRARLADRTGRAVDLVRALCIAPLRCDEHHSPRLSDGDERELNDSYASWYARAL